MTGRTFAAVAVAALFATPAAAQGLVIGGVEVHGFASQGAFVSTSNDYIGESSRGSLELFEVGVNVSSQLTERLRAGVQLFARDIGTFDSGPRIDWAFADYRFFPWLGLRAGIIKMPFGLYNEYADIDAARLPVLLPQSIYSVRNRDVLLAHRGFAVYGHARAGAAGELDYQAWLGTLEVPENALTLIGASLERADTHYVTGGHVFWSTPVAGLRVGGTYLRTEIDFHLRFSDANIEALIMAGLVPEDYDGALIISQRPASFVIGSIELARGDWLVAAEYARAFRHQYSTLPEVLPTVDQDSEGFYGMATYRVNRWLETGLYYSVLHADTGDRGGNDPRWAESWHAFQRDLGATLRFDVNDHWLWKLEGHFIDGTAELLASQMPDRYWGLFLIRTTVTF